MFNFIYSCLLLGIAIAILVHKRVVHRRLDGRIAAWEAAGLTVRWWPGRAQPYRRLCQVILGLLGLTLVASAAGNAYSYFSGSGTPSGLSVASGVFLVFLFPHLFEPVFGRGLVAYTEQGFFHMGFKREFNWDRLERMVYSDGKVVYRELASTQALLSGALADFRDPCWEAINARLANDMGAAE